MTCDQAVADVCRASASGPGSAAHTMPQAASCVATARPAPFHLRAGSSLVALEGELQIGWREHSLAWLGDAAPHVWTTLSEGERFVVPQSGVVSIRARRAHAASFIVLPPQARRRGFDWLRRAARRLTGLATMPSRRAR